MLVVGDLEPEIDEGYTVELSAPVNAAIGDATGAGTIIDDDAWTWFVAPDGHDGNDCLTHDDGVPDHRRGGFAGRCR